MRLDPLSIRSTPAAGAPSTASPPVPSPTAAQPTRTDHFTRVSGAAPTFKELAISRGDPLREKVATLLVGLTPASVPHDDSIYALRKQVLKLRQHLDIFAHVYQRDPKQFKALRDSLDQGYEALGRFKDLFDSQGLTETTRDPGTGAFVQTTTLTELRYKKGEVDERLAAALAWKRKFLAPERQAELKSMLAGAADPEGKKTVGSRFFWGSVDQKPKASLSGVENLQRLLAGLLDRAIEEYKPFKKLATPLGENQEVFHDYRKRVRSILNVLDGFPELTAPTLAPLRQTLVEHITLCGLIEDKLVGHELASKRGKGKQAKALEEEIEAKFAALKEWQKEHGVKDALKALRDGVH
ncbi:MAG: CHAD domain-containing protein [Deltaproteobacteria bacterium]|nr:CHAD domain-containing protein [Deltaproteobacteria bacterium]